MKIILEATPKEIADLVKEIQSQRDKTDNGLEELLKSAEFYRKAKYQFPQI